MVVDVLLSALMAFLVYIALLEVVLLLLFNMGACALVWYLRILHAHARLYVLWHGCHIVG